MKLLGQAGTLERWRRRRRSPFFFRQIGKTFPAEGERRYRVAMMAGCIANVSFARLNEATVRVLQKNGCEVTIPGGQTCCGALHVHAGIRDEARKLARPQYRRGAGRRVRRGDHQRGGLRVDAEGIRRAAGARSGVRGEGRKFRALMKDVTEFLASIELNRDMRDMRLADGDLPGLLPPGAWAEDPERAAAAADARFRG